MEEADAEETSQEEIETTWSEDNKKACDNSIRINLSQHSISHGQKEKRWT